jgi:hypothetical protein
MNTSIIKEKLTLAANAGGKLLIIACAMIIGYGISQFQGYLKNRHQSKVSTMPPTQTMATVSIAVNERGELLMIDRKNGSFQIYSDTVGRGIFNLYAGQMYAKMGSK